MTHRKARMGMSKVVLCNIRLVNWYGFTNTVIPAAENLTLISGENECGKSTILDAIKYAYTGDTQFNKATSSYNAGVGKRNLVSYTRCLIDPSAGIYARPAEKIPSVYTHIALEYYDQLNEKPFVLGVIIETAVTDIRGTYWYAMDGRRLSEIEFVYQENKSWKPYDAAGFQKKHGMQLRKKQEGIALFMQMVGLKLPYQEVAKYQTKLRNIMAYNPAAKIQEFIKESVLEKHDVNFDKLKEAKKNIEQINHSLELIQQELQDLDAILRDYDEHDKKALRIRIDDIKIKYKSLVSCQRKRQEAQELIQKHTITCENLEKVMEALAKEIEAIDGYYSEAKSALKELDVSKAINASKELLAEYESRLSILNREKEELETFQAKLQSVMELLRESGSNLGDFEAAGKLTSRQVEAADKKRSLELLKEEISRSRDELVRKEGYLSDELKNVQEECLAQTRIIDNCNRNRSDYSHVSEQTELIREINREFKKRGIQEEARMACEYVVELKEEGWRDAIEAFLGIHRYAVIVPPAYFDVANQVMDVSRHRYVELVNTRRLMARPMKCEEDAVYHFLEIRNEAAARYFAFWLGGIHGVEKEKVPEYDNAMSREGKLSRNMAVTYIDTRKIKSYCLGNEAIELNRQRAEKKLKELEAQEKEILAAQTSVRQQSDFLKKSLNEFKEFNLNVHNEWAKATADLSDEKKRYYDLLEAQKNNDEFMELSRRVSELERQLEGKKRERDKMAARKADLSAEIKVKTNEVKTLNEQEAQEQRWIEEESVLNKSAVETAMEEYDGYLLGENRDGGTMQSASKERIDRRVRELEANINGQQQAYNNRKQDVDKLPIGMEYEAEYQKRKSKIWMDDLQGIQQKLREQTLKYESIFKREFVLNIYEAAKTARSDISDINKELRKLRFSTRYQFDVKLLSDGSDYARILRYAEYLQDTNNMSDGQLSLTSLWGYESDEVEAREKEIKDIINRIIDKNDVAEINKFADYRNYMSYEIIINNEEVKDGKLSKQVGYNSGAGTQIPYTLILSAALSMLYNVRVNSVRLIFIDEPFEKMSDHNIKLMLDFFKDQDFQVIFCAPPNKLESIGSECGVIIPVLKNSNDDMQIGKVKFHEQQGL